MAPPSPNGFTGLAFDASSLHHVPPPLYNVSPSQPSSVNAAIKLSLTDHKSRHEAAVDMVEGTGLAARCVRQACNPIADHELLLVHTSRYIEYIKALAQTPTGMRVHKMKKTPHEFFMGDLTEYAARKSAGGVVGMCRQVFSGRLHNGFCLVRPSGSMALPDSSSSCCIYNNVALGAATLRQQGASKVMIVDLSRTFPEGIVECFKSEPSILVVSIHCKSECPNSLSSYTGEGPGTGYTCNVSLSPHSCVDDVYLSTLTSLVLPLGRAFRPDALLVSTGFDHSDYLPYGLTLDGYKDSLRLLLKLTKGRCICVTEGGGVKPPSYAAYSAGLLGVLLGEEDKESRVKGGGRSVLSPRTKDRSLGLLGKLSPRKLGSGGSKGKSKDKGKQDIIKSGWMSKQGHFRKSWKNRFFVLTPTKIGYYGHETWDSESPGKGLKGCILLYGAVVDTLADKPALKLLSGKKDKSKCLYIVGRSGEKDFVIDANSRSEAEDWCQEIRRAIHGCNDRKIRMSFDDSILDTTFEGSSRVLDSEIRESLRSMFGRWGNLSGEDLEDEGEEEWADVQEQRRESDIFFGANEGGRRGSGVGGGTTPENEAKKYLVSGGGDVAGGGLWGRTLRFEVRTLKNIVKGLAILVLAMYGRMSANKYTEHVRELAVRAVSIGGGAGDL